MGYLALPDVSPSPDDLKANFEAAFFSPLDATGLSLTATTIAAGKSLKIDLHVDPIGITLKPQGGRWVGSLEIGAQKFGPTSHELKGKSSVMNLNLKQVTYESVEREGLSFTNQAEIPPGIDRIRVVVRDIPSGAIGSLSIPVKPAAAGTGN
jgi:hypothetical protein